MRKGVGFPSGRIPRPIRRGLSCWEWDSIAAALVIRRNPTSGVPDFALVFNTHAVIIRSHKRVQQTRSVFPVFLGLLADRQRKRCSVQHETHLGTLEATRRERKHYGSSGGLHTIPCT